MSIIINIVVIILHVIIGIALGTAGVGVDKWQMWVIWMCIFSINILRGVL